MHQHFSLQHLVKVCSETSLFHGKIIHLWLFEDMLSSCLSLCSQIKTAYEFKYASNFSQHKHIPIKYCSYCYKQTTHDL